MNLGLAFEAMEPLHRFGVGHRVLTIWQVEPLGSGVPEVAVHLHLCLDCQHDIIIAGRKGFCQVPSEFEGRILCEDTLSTGFLESFDFLQLFIAFSYFPAKVRDQ